MRSHPEDGGGVAERRASGLVQYTRGIIAPALRETRKILKSSVRGIQERRGLARWSAGACRVVGRAIPR